MMGSPFSDAAKLTLPRPQCVKEKSPAKEHGFVRGPFQVQCTLFIRTKVLRCSLLI